MQSYIHDKLNRLATATEAISGTQTWTQTYGYHRYGIRTVRPIASGIDDRRRPARRFEKIIDPVR